MAQSDPPSKKRIANTPAQLTALDLERRRSFHKMMDGLRDTLEAGSFRKPAKEANFEAEYGFVPTPLLAQICKDLEPATVEGRNRIFHHVFQKMKDHYDAVFEEMELDVHTSIVEDIAAQILSIPPTADTMFLLEQVLGGRDVSYNMLAQRKIQDSELGIIPDPNNIYVTGARIGLAHASLLTVDEMDQDLDWVSATFVADTLKDAVAMPLPVTFMMLENLGCQEVENLAGSRFLEHKKKYFYHELMGLVTEEINARGGFCVFSANGSRELAILTFGVGNTESGSGGEGTYAAVFEALRRGFAENSSCLNVNRIRQRVFGRLNTPTTSHLAEHLFSVRFMEQEVDLASIDEQTFSPHNPEPFVSRLIKALDEVRINVDYSHFYFHRERAKPSPFDCGTGVDPDSSKNLEGLIEYKRKEHDLACDIFGGRPNSYLHIRPFAKLTGDALEYFRGEARARRKYQVLGETGRVRLSALEIMLAQNEIDQLHYRVLESITPNAGILRRYSDSSYFLLFRDFEKRRKAMAGMVRKLQNVGYPGIQPELLVYEFEANPETRQKDLKLAYDSVRLAKLLPFSVGFLGQPCTPEVFIVRGGAEEAEADQVSMFLARIANYAWRENKPDTILATSRNPLISFLDRSVIHVRDGMVSNFIEDTKKQFGVDLVDLLGSRPSNLDPYETIIQVHTQIRKVHGKENAVAKSKEFEQMLRRVARVCPMP